VTLCHSKLDIKCFLSVYFMRTRPCIAFRNLLSFRAQRGYVHTERIKQDRCLRFMLDNLVHLCYYSCHNGAQCVSDIVTEANGPLERKGLVSPK
jgi:hypothetical protein